MARSRETFSKKEVQSKKEKKRKEKEKKKLAKKEGEKKNSLDDMIAYVDEFGRITDTPPDLTNKEEINAEDIEIGVPTKEEEVEETVRTGVVDYFNDAKGFGFIKDKKTKESVFVHINNVIDEIKPGNLVTFEVEMGQKGPTAVRVKLSK